MLKCLLVVFFLSSLFICLSRAQEDEDLLEGFTDWNYKDAWKEEDYPECSKSNQSPIDLDTSMADNDATMSDVQFNWQRTKVPLDILTYTQENTIGMMSSDFTETTILSGVSYTIDALNFHWGSVSSQGSEHTVDGTQYSGEIEFFHYLKQDNTTKETDEIMVVSVLLQEDADLVEDLYEIKCIQSTFPNIRASEYGVYELKLTEVTSAFLAALRQFKYPDKAPMQDNFRKVQPLNDRKVYKSA